MSTSATKRLNYWQQQIDTWKASGLSAPKFCQANNITYHCFVYWRRKLGAVDTPPLPEKPSRGFVKVNVTPAPSECLSLCLPSGFVVRGIATENLAVVQQLLAIL